MHCPLLCTAAALPTTFWVFSQIKRHFNLVLEVCVSFPAQVWLTWDTVELDTHPRGC